MNRLRIQIMTFIYGGYVLLVTLYPFDLSPDLSKAFSEGFADFFKWSSLHDSINNVLLFVPLGIALYYRRILVNEYDSAILIAAGIAGAFSLAIEIAQSGFTRDPSACDVLLNTLGAAFGALLASLWPPRIIDLACRSLVRLEKAGIFLCLAVLLAGLPLVFSVAQWMAPFGIWNSQFSFQIANETSLDRPWLGKIHFVGVYNRALSPEQVKSNYDQGRASLPDRRVPPGLISAYLFSEGYGDIVHDRSGVQPAVDLRIEHQAAGVRWIQGSDGIEIWKPAIVRSREPATKFVEALASTHELSIEVWLTPRDTVQSGPARIISFSGGTYARNFMLGQRGASIEFRVRTPASGLNGRPLALKTTDEISPFERSHILATYKNGVERFYVNGAPQPNVLDLTRDGIIGLGTRKTLVGLVAYSFLYFFPVSFLLAVFLSIRSNSLMSRLLPFAIGAGLCGVTEVFQMIVFARGADFSVIFWSVFMAGLGTFSGRAFAMPVRCENFSLRLGRLAG